MRGVLKGQVDHYGQNERQETGDTQGTQGTCGIMDTQFIRTILFVTLMKEDIEEMS